MKIPKNIEQRIGEAIKHFWATREGQHDTGSRHDRGNRSAVTGAKQLDGFSALIRQLLLDNGISENSIFSNKEKLQLPGYYRSSKKWDLLLVDNDKLVLAIELKSHIGPSFSNNFNNRTEEALGSALDIWLVIFYIIYNMFTLLSLHHHTGI
jgi:hypothetical protein